MYIFYTNSFSEPVNILDVETMNIPPLNIYNKESSG